MVATEQLSEGLTDRRETMEAVKLNISKSQDKVRKRKMERGQEDNFVVGDKVLVRNVRQENRKGGKMDPDMLGPFTVVKIEEKIVDVVSKKGKKTMTFNTDHLIKYVEPEPHIPKKWIPSNSASLPPPASPRPPPPASPRPPPPASPRPPLPPPASLPSSTKGLSAPNGTSTNPCLKVLSSPRHTATHSVDGSNAQTQVNPSGPSTHSCSPDTFHASANSEENVINDIWEGKKQQVLWSKMGPYKLFTNNMMDLAPGKQLESELAENLLMEEEITLLSNEEGTASMRMDIARTLLRESDDLSQLCHYCEEQDKDQTDQWIECTECGRWYHWDCVDRPSTAGKYTCPACI
ncbi:hypothetical protein G5714_009020 [Onychostoma macrolepis]|uniref:PHD-type domain-containing protein n=1 Tax=Onychostoma macrolepis TaxID=369639 RepID=A0A7J6CQZ6_9TELE|nr:hypothetical protein G5714_009020 [Onychostoma macrolepis]